MILGKVNEIGPKRADMHHIPFAGNRVTDTPL